MILVIVIIFIVILIIRRNKVQGNIKADKVKIIKGWNKNTVSWDEFFELYDETIKNKYEILTRPPGFFILNEGSRIERVQRALKILNCTLGHAYASITTAATSFDMHHDEEDTFFWQCIGKTMWEIEGDDTVYILEPSDLFVIPKMIRHKVTPLTPRMGISMSI